MLQPTAYADVNEALRYLLAETQAILGARLEGIYLLGSLAVGDFDPRTSDLDLVIVIEGALADDLFAALRAMHARFAASGSPWAAKLEAVYIPREALRGAGPAGARYPVLEQGGELAWNPLEDAWSVQCFTLREHGISLAGPDPRTLLDPVDADDMRREGVAIAEEWLARARTDPSWLAWMRERGNQAFVVLTLCRLLYTLETGSVASKPGAARWAQPVVWPRWAGLIERAPAGLRDPSMISDTEAWETVAFIAYTVDRFRQWAASVPSQMADGASQGVVR